KYVIAEAKYGASQLGNTKSGRQMSDEWLKTRRRLENAVGQTKADEIQMEILLNPNNVEKQLIKVEGNGNIVNSKLSTHGYRMKGKDKIEKSKLNTNEKIMKKNEY